MWAHGLSAQNLQGMDAVANGGQRGPSPWHSFTTPLGLAPHNEVSLAPSDLWSCQPRGHASLGRPVQRDSLPHYHLLALGRGRRPACFSRPFQSLHPFSLQNPSVQAHALTL